MHSFLLWHHLSCSFLFLRVLIMRYLLHQSQFKELHARQTYLYDIFHLYFVPTKSEGNFIVLVPLGRNYSNILFITGHTNFVWEYMLSHIHQLPERRVVITSCFGNIFRKFARDCEIYVPDFCQDLCPLRSGIPYGFQFDISDAELCFYNTPGAIEKRIHAAYKQLL